MNKTRACPQCITNSTQYFMQMRMGVRRLQSVCEAMRQSGVDQTTDFWAFICATMCHKTTFIRGAQKYPKKAELSRPVGTLFQRRFIGLGGAPMPEATHANNTGPNQPPHLPPAHITPLNFPRLGKKRRKRARPFWPWVLVVAGTSFIRPIPGPPAPTPKRFDFGEKPDL